MNNPPTIYLLHGEDDMAAMELVDQMRSKLGDPATAELNFQRFSGAGLDISLLASACFAIPFLSARRLIAVEDASSSIKTDDHQVRFLELLGTVPSTTALVLIEKRELKRSSPLLQWAQSHPERCYIRRMEPPKGSAFIQWVHLRCHSLGGEIDNQAAYLLAELVEEDTHMALREIQKLLDYVDHKRPIEVADVELLTPFHGQSNVFAMVDAVGNRNPQSALSHLKRLLEDEDAGYAFAMIVRQFRLLMQAREALDMGSTVQEALSVHPFVAKKIESQAKNYSISRLESLYHKLLEIDLAVKTGHADLVIELDRFIADLTLSILS